MAGAFLGGYKSQFLKQVSRGRHHSTHIFGLYEVHIWSGTAQQSTIEDNTQKQKKGPNEATGEMEKTLNMYCISVFFCPNWVQLLLYF